MKKEFKIKAQNTTELAQKICTLYNWTKKRINTYYIQFSNFERIYFNKENNFVYANIIDSQYRYNKALELKII